MSLDPAYFPDGRLPFRKMQGLGNDFVVVEPAAAGWTPPADLVRRLADRRLGVGFDQLLIVEPPDDASATLAYRIYNADGGEVEQCGNGARCVALLAARRAGVDAFTLQSPPGPIRARMEGPGMVALDMGEPDFRAAALPFDAGLADTAGAPASKTKRADAYTMEFHGISVEFGTVSMGNPHAVIPVSDVDTARVDGVGAAMNTHPAFPEGVNAGFVERVDSSHLRLRVYERGCGETPACGTGACAAAAVMRRWDLTEQEVAVDLPGGRLTLRWPGPGHPLWMIGPAEETYEGTIHP